MTARRIGFAPILVPAALVAILTDLGAWQIGRMHWKHRLLAAIATAETRPPARLAAARTPSQFERVVLTGRLDPRFEAEYASDVRDVEGVPTFGVFLIEPSFRAGAPPVLIDLGWVPASTSGHPAVTVSGVRTVVGYVRRPERGGMFTPPPDIATRQFYALDPATIGRSIGLGPVAPFTVVALRSPDDAAFPAAAPSMPRPPDNHFQYAVTWFTLAAITVLMTGAWWRDALRQRRSDA